MRDLNFLLWGDTYVGGSGGDKRRQGGGGGKLRLLAVLEFLVAALLTKASFLL